MNTELIKEKWNMYSIKFDEFVKICLEKLHYYITKRDFHIFITPYLCKFVILILHTILLITVIALMCINKLTSILFYKWTEFMNIIGRKRVILDRESEKPYMERYYLLFTERDNYFPFNIFIHHILESDNDELHDHPWGYFTLILSGGYFEHLKLKDAETGEDRVVKIWRGPGFYQSVSSSWVHRLELDKTRGETWTLFIPYRQEKEWGFYTKNGYIDNEEYFKQKKNN